MKETQAKLTVDKALEFMAEEMGDLGGFLQYLFSCMEIAEQAVADKKTQYPEHEQLIDKTWQYLRPTGPFVRDMKSTRLFRPHCDELIERSIRGMDLCLGTKAEVCAVLYLSSLKYPLNNDATFTYVRLFEELFPEEGEHLRTKTGRFTLYESYDGVSDEIISMAQRKLKTDRTHAN